MSDQVGGRLVGNYLLVTPAEHDAIIAEYVANTEPGRSPDTTNTLGKLMTPGLSSELNTYHVLVIEPDGVPHEIPGTNQVAITPRWDPTCIYVMPSLL